MKNQNKYYIIIFKELFGVINSLESDLKRYSIPHRRNYDDSITNINYQDKTYTIRNYITRFQREALHKKGIEITREAELQHQYVEVEMHNNLYNEKDNNYGLPQIIYDGIIKASSNPIYHFNFITQNEMVDLKANYKLQFIDRQTMSDFINNKPEKLSEDKITSIEEQNDAWILRECNIPKEITMNSKLAWYSIGEHLGIDGWGMTALLFTPIKIQQLMDDINSINYNQYIKDFLLRGICNEAKVLRLEHDLSGEDCSYFIDNISEFKYREITRVY